MREVDPASRGGSTVTPLAQRHSRRHGAHRSRRRSVPERAPSLAAPRQRPGPRCSFVTRQRRQCSVGGGGDMVWASPLTSVGEVLGLHHVEYRDRLDARHLEQDRRRLPALRQSGALAARDCAAARLSRQPSHLQGPEPGSCGADEEVSGPVARASHGRISAGSLPSHAPPGRRKLSLSRRRRVRHRRAVDQEPLHAAWIAV
jgi:hypothetical protein